MKSKKYSLILWKFRNVPKKDNGVSKCLWCKEYKLKADMFNSTRCIDCIQLIDKKAYDVIKVVKKDVNGRVG